MSVKNAFLLAGAASVLALYGCNNPGDMTKMATPAGGAVAATVNGTAISENRVGLMIKQAAAQGQPSTPEMRKDVIEHLAIQLLLSQEAAKQGLDKAADVAEQLDLARQSILANAFVQDRLKNSPVGEDALKSEYEKIKGQMAGTEYRARHILVAKEADAEEIIAKLSKNPKAFAALAKEKSKDPGSAAAGGDLGWFDPRGMVPEFSQAVTQLEKGAVTAKPVKSQFGYHVIMLEDARTKEAPPLEQIKPMLQQQLAQQSLRKLIDDTKAKAKIEITPSSVPDAAKEDKPSGTAKN